MSPVRIVAAGMSIMPANWPARSEQEQKVDKESTMTDEAKIRLTATVTGAG